MGTDTLPMSLAQARQILFVSLLLFFCRVRVAVECRSCEGALVSNIISAGGKAVNLMLGGESHALEIVHVLP